MFKKITEGIKYKIEETKNLYGFGVNQAFSNFSNRLNSLFIDREFFDEEFFEDFEEKLIELDIVPLLAIMIRDKVEKKILNERANKDNFLTAMYEAINDTVNLNLNNDLILNQEDLNVLLVMGINGVGKTTTISKLMHKYKKNYNLEVVAADTFRAGAIEQLNTWAQKEEVPITKTHEGHAPSAVIYDGVTSAIENNRNLLICDTAGRLHNQDNLMEELKKITKVIEGYKQRAENPQKINLKKVLVLDGTAGKNTINQAQSFKELTDIDGIIVTKMDTNAKAGMIINIAYEINKPIYFITTGEAIDKITKFDYTTYLEMLLGE